MKEISLHILDLVENSINADAKLIKLLVCEDYINDKLTITIEDNGKGMSSELLKRVENPFVTTRTTRNVGLGIPLIKANALMCDGSFKIDSKEGVGTKLEIVFKLSHIDRAPLGNITDTIICIITNQKNIDLYYKHIVNNKEFVFDTMEIKRILGDDQLNDIEIIMWIKDYLTDNLEKLYNDNLYI